MKGDIQPERAPSPPRPMSAAEQAQRALKDAKLRADYEKEFPYDKPSAEGHERIHRRGPVVSGGLPTLGKRR